MKLQRLLTKELCPTRGERQVQMKKKFDKSVIVVCTGH